jgi:type I restriction enzyme S subunit
VSYWDKPIFLTDAFSLHPEPGVMSPRFLFHLLRHRQERVHGMKRGAGVPHVRISDFESLRVPVPSLEEQARLTSILDRFDALVSDISIGLPAELNARRKQHQYYRDRLMTFKEAA